MNWFFTSKLAGSSWNYFPRQRHKSFIWHFRKNANPMIQLLYRSSGKRRGAEVLFWIAKGKRNGEIGQILAISLRTVEKHVEHILLKLSVETRTSAGAVAMDYLTDPGI